MIQSNMTSKQSKVIVKPAKVNISVTKVANALLSSQISNNSAVEISQNENVVDPVEMHEEAVLPAEVAAREEIEKGATSTTNID